MKTARAVVLLALLSAAVRPARAAYTYYSTLNLTAPMPVNSGTGSFTPDGLRNVTATTILGGLPGTPAAYDYEVKSTLKLTDAWGGCFLHYLRASGDAFYPGNTGTFYATRVCRTGPGESTVYILKRVGGVVTTLVQAQGIWLDGMSIRSTMHGNLICIILDDQFIASELDTEIVSGYPGIGTDGQGSLNYMATAMFGKIELVPPPSPTSQSIRSTVSPNAVDLAWDAAQDDAEGIGVAYYWVERDGLLCGLALDPNYYDAAVAPGHQYSYSISAVDFHGNGTLSSAVTVTVTTPPAGSIDARQVGVRPLGSYWGTAGEQIDLRSGNLNYTVPLLTTKGRNGKDVTFGLNYNSQLWRQDGDGTWRLGTDVGYGYGWRLMAGAITPVWGNNWTLHHYVYTDSTGSEYHLDVNDNGKWRSREGIYVAYDPVTSRLYFRDGSYWVMGAVSGGVEQDAGSRYPTEFRDTHGNRVFARYLAGRNAGRDNSSGRLWEIEDVRAKVDANTMRSVTYAFTWDTAATPARISRIDNRIGTAETYTFVVGTGSLISPFAGAVNFGTVGKLQSVSNGAGQTTSFAYNGDSFELERVTQPAGGYMRWVHGTFTFSGSRSYREVRERYLAKDSGAAEQSYALGRDPNDVNRTAHYYVDFQDFGASSAKLWWFHTSADWALGMLDAYQEAQMPGWVSLVQKNVYYAQNSTGNPYITRILTFTDPNMASLKTSQVDQTVDGRGNVVEVKQYDYDQTTTPARTYTNTYVTDSTYTNQEKWNLLLTSSVTAGSQTVQLVSNTYDGTAEGFSGGPKCTAAYSGHTWIAPATPEGKLTKLVAPGRVANFRYSNTGAAVESNDGNGHENATCLDPTFTKPAAITPQGNSNLTTSVNYTQALAPGSVTEPNNAVTSIVYDGVSRPSQTTSKFGAVTTYEYSNSPAWTKATTNGRWVKTWVDSFGRTIKVEKGDTSGTKSVQETEYGPCACSPLGKVSRVSRPHAPGQTPAWTTYQYDARGRTTRVTLPDGSATVYVYAGNAVTITDAASKWKAQVTDAFGNLVQVVEPNPAGGDNWVTNYTFDQFDRLVQVSMPRGTVTQTRTWSYDATTQRLNSVTQPETGTTTYTWNADGTLLRKTDARGMKVEFTYDAYLRVTKKTPKFANGTVDVANVVDYYYDSYGSYVTNAWGRLAATRTGYGTLAGGTPSPYIVEKYNYASSGATVGKTMVLWRYLAGDYSPWLSFSTSMTFAYDNEGRVTGEDNSAVTYGYDTMGRPYSGPGAALVSYGPADEVLTVANQRLGDLPASLTETREYNTLGQMTRQVAQFNSQTLYDFQYTFAAAGVNNGRISRFKDGVTNEVVNYSYDAVNRLTGSGLSYDGFGNLLSGYSFSNLVVDGTTNRIMNTGYSYDLAGNLTAAPNLAAMSYNPEGRMTQIGTEVYRYGADGTRLMKGTLAAGQNTDVYFRDPWGRLRQVATYYRSPVNGYEQFTVGKRYDWFLGKPVERGAQKWLGRDRLGSVRAVVTGGPSAWAVTTRTTYAPYGESNGAPTGTWGYGTYWREGNGLNYAEQRWYGVAGRFTSADRYGGSGRVSDPGTWNRYSYVGGDPTNFNDPTGRNRQALCYWRNDVSWEDGWVFSGTESYICDEWGGGSGGGLDPTGDPESSGRKVGPPTGAQFAGFNEAFKALDNPKCAGLIAGTSGASAAALRNDLWNALVTVGTSQPGNAKAKITTAPDGFYMYSYQTAYTSGGNIELNGNYFPDPTQQNIAIPGGTTSLLDLVNRTLGSNLNATQLGAFVFLHELSHIAGAGSSIDNSEYNKAIISTCLY